MNNTTFGYVSAGASDIRRLARGIDSIRCQDARAEKLAARAVARPIDYMRWAEFEAVLRMFQVSPGQRVLDVASPQWFTLHLAARHPEVQFSYINIQESEVAPFRAISESLGLRNIEYGLGDVRTLSWPDATFDKVISISVLEHIYPDIGGDVLALEDIRRVLKPEGELLLTVPCKAKSSVVYMDGPVYERGKSGKNFFAREYDMDSFHDLVTKTGFQIDEEWRIEEHPGLFAVDYWEWGDGSGKGLWPWLLRKRGKLERLTGFSLDEFFAKRHLQVNKTPNNRLVNVAARLKPQPRQPQ
ncbi:MAG: hypothetical protein CALGDGBN_02336 [Pseudomonadales bacterium]|nr:hypothetical protein [Pseudomonadales bacterium]